MSEIKIEGLDELKDFLKDHPKELQKSVLESLTRGARICNKQMAAAMPSALQKFKAILSVKKLSRTAIPMVMLGFFGRKVQFVNRRGIRWDAWNIVYWLNYGTNANRDKNHEFASQAKARKRSELIAMLSGKPKRGRAFSKSLKVRPSIAGGIKPLNFFEKGYQAGFQPGLDAASADIEKTLDMVSAKYGFK